MNEDGKLIEPLVEEKVEYDKVLSGNDLDGNGSKIDPIVNKVLEYNGVLSSNGLDEDGKEIEPLVYNKPELEILEDKVNKPKSDINSGNSDNKVEVIPATISSTEKVDVLPQEKVSSPKTKVIAQSDSKTVSKGQLPNTGTAENAAFTLAGISLALIGVGLAGKRKYN